MKEKDYDKVLEAVVKAGREYFKKQKT